MKRISLIILLLTTLFAIPSWAAKPTKFFFMPFIYKSLGVKDVDKLEFQEESVRKAKFTYNGVSYEAQTLNCGAIFMKGGGREWIINFDMSVYKRPTLVKPYSMD